MNANLAQKKNKCGNDGVMIVVKEHKRWLRYHMIYKESDFVFNLVKYSKNPNVKMIVDIRFLGSSRGIWSLSFSKIKLKNFEMHGIFFFMINL
jgi:hypothetical protein